MGVPRIPGADNGTGHTPYRWNYSNQSANLRFGALVALSLLPQADALDIVLPFEMVSGSVVSGPIVGVNTTAPAEDTLQNALAKDDIGVQSMSIASGIGRHVFILSPNQSPTADAPFLIPDPAHPGNVIVMPDGSGVSPVARALSYPPTSGAEQYVEAEFMPALSVGLAANPGQLVFGDATDVVVAGKYVATSGGHVAPAAPKNTPVLFRATVPTRFTVEAVDLSVAPGAGNGVHYAFRIGATPALAVAAAEITFAEILDAATTGAPTGAAGQPKTFIMPAGTVLVCQARSVAGGVGTAEHSMITGRAQ